MSENNNTSLQRHLGFKELFIIALSSIIGAGIFSMTGVAIGATGRSVPIAFLISSLIVIVMTIPTIIINATARFRGGQYSVISTLIGEMWGGFYTLVIMASAVSISIYAISFSDYLSSIFPSINQKIVAISILTIMYLANYVGAKFIARMQAVVVFVLILAIGLFIYKGLGNIEPNYIGGDFFLNGMPGLLQAASIMTYSIGGAAAIANLSAEAKNPTKHIPMIIVIATVLMAFVYALMAIVAAGVLPVSVVSNQPLDLVAREILNNWQFRFFIIGGALFGLISPMNSNLLWMTKPPLQAVKDGWLPEWLGKIHPIFNTPTRLLTVVYLTGLTPVLLDLNIQTISSAIIVFYQPLNIMMSLSMYRIKKVMPELWAKSKFHVSDGMLKFITLLCLAIGAVQIVILIRGMSKAVAITVLIMSVLGLLYTYFRYKSGKVKTEISYEAD